MLARCATEVGITPLSTLHFLDMAGGANVGTANGPNDNC